MSLLSRWEPVREWGTVQDELNRLFDNAFRGFGQRYGNMGLTPACDVNEDPEKFVVAMDVPGVEKKDIEVHVENEVLTIHAKRQLNRSEKKDSYLAVERVEGTFARTLSLPNVIDAEKVSAEYKNGVLTITLPKRAEARPRQIDVKIS